MKNLFSVSVTFLILSFGAALAQVSPKQKDGKVFLSSKGVYFEVDPSAGGRISSFKLHGKEVLYVDTANKNNNWGSTFWPAPQSRWGWPPPDTLDSKPYSLEIKGSQFIVKSKKMKGNPSCGFVKTFSFNSKDTSIVVNYGMVNNSQKANQMAPWQIARVPSGGISFFPSGKTEMKGDLLPLFENQGGVTWFDYDSTKIPSGVPKLFSDGSEGWLAHVNNDGLLLVFKFADIDPSQKAKGEDEIEFYAHPDKYYVELEPLGAYTSIPVGGTKTWQVKWYLRQLPKHIQVQNGSQSLVAYVRKMVGGK
jgi:hypothetical protein